MANTTKVIAAVYASNNKTGLGFDVTQRCQQFVTADQPIPVNDTSFGDPNPGNKKYFTMTYSVNKGPVQYVGAIEGQTVTVP